MSVDCVGRIDLAALPGPGDPHACRESRWQVHQPTQWEQAASDVRAYPSKARLSTYEWAVQMDLIHAADATKLDRTAFNEPTAHNSALRPAGVGA